MKAILGVQIALAFFSCNLPHRQTGAPFTADRITRTPVITLHGAPAEVFPLFGPLDEKKWAEEWNPEFLYPRSGAVEEGMVFRTPGHGHDETDYNWIVAVYRPDEHRIGYSVSTPNRFWTIDIRCATV